jgi:hypothetical protein
MVTARPCKPSVNRRLAYFEHRVLFLDEWTRYASCSLAT